MTKRYLGNIITQNPTAPAGNFEGSAAKGVWSLEEQLAYQKAGLWPVPGNAPVDITDVFSTYLYEGTGAANTITNGIDLAGEGGLTWIKVRSQTQQHALFDTERGATKYLKSSATSAEATRTDTLTSFNSNGFSLGNDSSGALVNTSGQDYVSWTFRKAPKFFTCVTWSGDGVAGREIAHDLNATVGTLIVKCTSESRSWFVWHRGLSNGGDGWIALNDTAAEGSSSSLWNSTIPTNSVFTLGSSINTNGDSKEYVAYLFAHNDGDGGFGPDADQDIIKCGSVTGDTSGDFTVDLGWEPQWVLTKWADATGDWALHDTMRGFGVTNRQELFANTSGSEVTQNNTNLTITSTGFVGDGYQQLSKTLLYMAIRRGPLAPPTAATEVFAMDTQGSSAPYFDSGFPVDMAFYRPTSSDHTQIASRITGDKRLYINLTSSEGSSSGHQWDYMDGWYGSAINNNQSWMWKRAPNFFDVVAYSGNSTAGRTVSHNLGVVPEMIWVKRRDASGYDWNVYVSGQSNVGYLNSSNGFIYSQIVTATADSSFTLNNDIQGNASGGDYIAYLFASLDGISKVGSYTGNGSSQTIDCGFTSGARFVLIKRTDSTGNWFLWDSERGIVSGSEPFLMLDQTNPEQTGSDEIDPDNSGFTVNQSYYTDNNVSGGNYIFYAIA